MADVMEKPNYRVVLMKSCIDEAMGDIEEAGLSGSKELKALLKLPDESLIAIQTAFFEVFEVETMELLRKHLGTERDKQRRIIDRR